MGLSTVNCFYCTSFELGYCNDCKEQASWALENLLLLFSFTIHDEKDKVDNNNCKRLFGKHLRGSFPHVWLCLSMIELVRGYDGANKIILIQCLPITAWLTFYTSPSGDPIHISSLLIIILCKCKLQHTTNEL